MTAMHESYEPMFMGLLPMHSRNDFRLPKILETKYYKTANRQNLHHHHSLLNYCTQIVSSSVHFPMTRMQEVLLS